VEVPSASAPFTMTSVLHVWLLLVDLSSPALLSYWKFFNEAYCLVRVPVKV
jgi:hypothetical protein